MDDMRNILLGLAFLIPSVSFASTLTQDQVNAILGLLQAFSVPQETISIVQSELQPSSTTTPQITINTATPSVTITPTPVVVPDVVQTQPTFGAVTPVLPTVILDVHQSTTTTSSGTGEARFSVSTTKDGFLTKLPVTVTTNDPDLPSQFQLNAPGQLGWFCVAPTYPDFPNHGCQNENPVSVGTFTFTFTVNDYAASSTNTVTVQ